LLGPSPTLSEEGWIELLVHMQLNAIIAVMASVTFFGIFAAAAITLVTVIASSWQSGTSINMSDLRGRFFPNILLVWVVLVISNVAEILAYSALYLPGLYLSIIWYAAADERRGPFSALKRSMDLTRDFRWFLLVLVFLAAVFNFSFEFFRASVLFPSFLDGGFEAEQWRIIDLGLATIVWILKQLVGIIVAASTYLVLKQAAAGVTQNDVDATFS